MKYFKYISLSTVLIILDQYSKQLAIEHLAQGQMYGYVNNFFRLIFARNPGAWGSLGSDWPSPLKEISLILIPTLVLGYIFYSLFSNKTNKLEKWSYSLILAGGIGNLIDRVKDGSVIDMFWFGFEKYKYLQTNIFNLADVYVMIGVGFLLLNYFVEKKSEKSQSKA